LEQLDLIAMLVHNLALIGFVVLFLVACHRSWSITRLGKYVLLLFLGTVIGLLIVSSADPPRLLGLSMAVAGYAFAAMGIYAVRQHHPRH